MSNAVITVFYPQTGFERTVQSTSAGEYVLSALPLGRCNVNVVAAGFEAKHIDDIDLQVGEFRTVNLQLSVGAVEQTVAVAASTVTLDQDSAATGGVIARAQVENLPINGRNWAGLMILVPGAINTGSGNQTSIRFAGHGVDDNRILFDGVDASGILRQSNRYALSLRGEGFNLLNRAQYGLPATNVSATNFGQITTQLNPGATGTATQRVFEFGLRFTF